MAYATLNHTCAAHAALPSPHFATAPAALPAALAIEPPQALASVVVVDVVMRRSAGKHESSWDMRTCVWYACSYKATKLSGLFCTQRPHALPISTQVLITPTPASAAVFAASAALPPCTNITAVVAVDAA